MNIQAKDAVNQLARDFIENARDLGIAVENIEVDWINGKYDAKINYSKHRVHIPTINGTEG